MTDNQRIFSFLLPDRELCGEQELYYRNKGGQSALFGNTLLLKEGAEVSFDSYFKRIGIAFSCKTVIIKR